MLPTTNYPRCHWEADGKRCRYPGTMSASVRADEGTQWFCSVHFWCRDPVFGADIVQASQDYRHVDDTDKIQREAKAYCEAHGLHTVDQMRQFCKDKVRGIGKFKDAA